MTLTGIPFIDFLNEVDDLLESRYGITAEDGHLSSIASCQEEGWAVEDTVAWISEKYDLVRIA